ncbi:MAG: DUF6751 family protein, partial [Ruthenibacterium sp.]
VTLYHRQYSESVREDVWSHTQYRGVQLHGGKGVKLVNNRYVTDDSYILRIYTQERISACEGDIVVRGLHDDDTPTAAQRAEESFRVTSVTDNRRGSARVRHWKIGGA